MSSPFDFSEDLHVVTISWGTGTLWAVTHLDALLHGLLGCLTDDATAQSIPVLQTRRTLHGTKVECSLDTKWNAPELGCSLKGNERVAALSAAVVENGASVLLPLYTIVKYTIPTWWSAFCHEYSP